MRISDWSSDVCSSDLTIAEVVDDLGVLPKTPVAEHPDDVAVHRNRLALIDDQRTVEAAPGLLEAALVRVIPVSPGIGHLELVDEGFARRDRRLGQARHTVHRIRNAHATGRASCRERACQYVEISVVAASRK